MVLFAVLNPLIALGLLAVVIPVTPSRWLPGISFGLIAGAVTRVVGTMRRKRPPGRVLGETDDPDLFAILNRLCALANIPKPELVLSDQAQPNSWMTHLPGRAPRLYLIRGLREALTLDELQAVLGHELAHIANRDALVMTTAGAPAAMMLRVNGAAGLDAVFILAIGILSQLVPPLRARLEALEALERTQ